MTGRKLILLLILAGCTSMFTACSSDSDNNEELEQQLRENDWMLEGIWQLNNGGTETSATEIMFRTDGSGLYGGMPMKWYTYANELFMSMYDGSSIKTSYSITGATLHISSLGVYVTQLPVTGTWYAADAMSVFKGGTFCYHFDENGDGIKYTFDYMGLTAKTYFKWNRSHNGISIIYRYATEDKVCTTSGTDMYIEGEGSFTSALPFYGSWKAVDSYEGLITEDDDNYSTLNMEKNGDGSYFTCRHHDSTFQGTMKIATSHQQVYNDQHLLIIKDVTGSGDAFTLAYRFFYYPDHNKVYLDLGSDYKFNDFVRYELIR